MRRSGTDWMVRTLGVALAAFGLAGCGDSTAPELRSSVSLAVGVPSSSQTQASAHDLGEPGASGELVQSDGQSTLVITRVAVVLREVELERQFDDDCDDAGAGSDDACEEFEAGPFLLELPLDGSIQQVLSVQVPPDSYDELEFDVHKSGDDSPEEIAFLTEHPDFDGISIRVEGTFDGEPFTFLQDLSEEQEIDLDPPLVVTEESGPINLTLTLDVGAWFVDVEGNLIDPRTANVGGQYEELVEDNIRASIEAFEDDDVDGEED